MSSNEILQRYCIFRITDGMLEFSDTDFLTYKGQDLYNDEVQRDSQRDQTTLNTSGSVDKYLLKKGSFGNKEIT